MHLISNQWVITVFAILYRAGDDPNMLTRKLMKYIRAKLRGVNRRERVVLQVSAEQLFIVSTSEAYYRGVNRPMVSSDPYISRVFTILKYNIL